MPMRILALVPEAATARRCLELAQAAAAIAGAEIEAFHVKVDPERLRTAEDEVALQHLRVEREGTAEDRARAVRDVYAQWRADLLDVEPPRVTWREAIGAEEASVVAEAAGFDLIVLPRPHNMDGGDAHHAAFRRAHRPLLVASDHGPRPAGAFGRRAVIAWKPGAHARRAIEGAAVWLRVARSVSTVMIAPDLEQAGWPEFERLARQLGIAAVPVLRQHGDLRIGEELLIASEDLEADCAVFGAYRHADLIEWALPSTTRFVLENARIPLFMAH